MKLEYSLSDGSSAVLDISQSENLGSEPQYCLTLSLTSQEQLQYLLVMLPNELQNAARTNEKIRPEAGLTSTTSSLTITSNCETIELIANTLEANGYLQEGLLKDDLAQQIRVSEVSYFGGNHAFESAIVGYAEKSLEATSSLDFSEKSLRKLNSETCAESRLQSSEGVTIRGVVRSSPVAK